MDDSLPECPASPTLPQPPFEVVRTMTAQHDFNQIQFSNPHKAEWLMKRAVSTCATQAGGTVYGGFVRDYVTHQDGAQKFYAKFGASSCHEYDNPFTDPTTHHRLVNPRDIDVAFRHHDELNDFEHQLGRAGLHLCTKERVSKSIYQSAFMPPSARFYKLVIGLQLPAWITPTIGQQPMVHVDVHIMPHKCLAPFTEVDFECNALAMFNCKGNAMMDINTCHCPPQQHYDDALKRSTYVNKIVCDILAKRAVVATSCSRLPFHRVNKMLRKGYTVSSHSCTVLPNDVNNANEVCIVCHENLGDKYHHIKRLCCNARYHPKCFETVLDQGFSDGCIMCRSRQELHRNDYTLLRSVVDHYALPSATSSSPASSDVPVFL